MHFLEEHKTQGKINCTLTLYICICHSFSTLTLLQSEEINIAAFHFADDKFLCVTLLDVLYFINCSIIYKSITSFLL